MTKCFCCEDQPSDPWLLVPVDVSGCGSVCDRCWTIWKREGRPRISKLREAVAAYLGACHCESESQDFCMCEKEKRHG